MQLLTVVKSLLLLKFLFVLFLLILIGKICILVNINFQLKHAFSPHQSSPSDVFSPPTPLDVLNHIGRVKTYPNVYSSCGRNASLTPESDYDSPFTDPGMETAPFVGGLIPVLKTPALGLEINAQGVEINAQVTLRTNRSSTLPRPGVTIPMSVCLLVAYSNSPLQFILGW